MILSPRLCAHEHCDCIYIFPQGISPGEDNISINYIYISLHLCMCCLFCLFICVCPFGSCKSTYLLSFSLFLDHLDLAIYQLIYLLTYWSICLLFYLLVYWPIWEHDSLICTYINTIYIYYLYHLVIISRYSYCKLSASHLFLYPASIYFSFYLFVHTYPCFFSLCMSLSCDCLSVAFSKDLGPGKYMYDPRT